MKPNDEAYQAAIKTYNIHSAYDAESVPLRLAVDAAYAAQFPPSVDYAELVKWLRDKAESLSEIYPPEAEAADALEAVLAERDAERERFKYFGELHRQEYDRICSERDALFEARSAERYWEARWRDEVKENDKLKFERDALLARLAPVEDEKLVEIVAVYCSPEMNWNEMSEKWKNSCRRDARAAIAAIRPHIEAAALSDLVEFSKRKNWELAYRTPSYSGDPDQKEYWVVWERAGIDQDREWEPIGKGETASEAIAEAIRSGK